MPSPSGPNSQPHARILAAPFDSFSSAMIAACWKCACHLRSFWIVPIECFGHERSQMVSHFSFLIVLVFVVVRGRGTA